QPQPEPAHSEPPHLAAEGHLRELPATDPRISRGTPISTPRLPQPESGPLANLPSPWPSSSRRTRPMDRIIHIVTPGWREQRFAGIPSPSRSSRLDITVKPSTGLMQKKLKSPFRRLKNTNEPRGT